MFVACQQSEDLCSLPDQTKPSQSTTRSGLLRSRALTQSEAAELESLFPYLDTSNVLVTDEATYVYNCIAYAMGITWKWINPRSNLYALEDQFVNAKNEGAPYNFSVVNPYYINADVDGWGNTVADMTHASVRYDYSDFESKLGASLRITHARTDLEGGMYGSILTSFVQSYSKNADLSKLKELALEVDKNKVTISNQERNSIITDAKKVSQDSNTNNFESLFEAWKQEWKTNPITLFSNNTNDAKKLKQYPELLAMGNYIIPLLLEKLLNEENFFALVLYDDLQQNSQLKITYNNKDNNCLEGEQNRAKRTIKLWLNK